MDKIYEYKACIGYDKQGKAIRKSYYSNISIEDAMRKADRASRNRSKKRGFLWHALKKLSRIGQTACTRKK